jgi:hypothetical protein
MNYKSEEGLVLLSDICGKVKEVDELKEGRNTVMQMKNLWDIAKRLIFTSTQDNYTQETNAILMISELHVNLAAESKKASF